MIIIPFIATDEDDDLIPGQTYVDYGINVDTLETIPLPTELYDEFVTINCYFSEELEEYILKG